MRKFIWSLVIIIIILGGLYLLGKNIDKSQTENGRLMEGSNQPIPNSEYAPGEGPNVSDTNNSTWNQFDGEIGI